jgi:hypothetical protein
MRGEIIIESTAASTDPVAIGCTALLLYHDLAEVQTPKQIVSAEKF